MNNVIGRSMMLGLVVVVAVGLQQAATVAGADPADQWGSNPAEQVGPPPTAGPEPDAEEAELTATAMARGALGLFYEDGTREFVVVLPNEGSPFTLSEVDALGLAVRVHVSSVDRRDVDDARQGLRAIARRLLGADDVMGFYFDPRTEKIVVATSLPMNAFTSITETYPALLHYRSADGGRESRHNDWAPFFGGAEVEKKPFANDFCSTGFAVKETSSASATRYMVTAGHCWPLNTAVYSPGSGNWMGSIVAQATFPARDIELIGGSTYAAIIYTTGAAGTQGGKSVLSAANPAVDYPLYCRSGAGSFRKCNLRVSTITGEYCSGGGQCTPNVVVYRSLNGEDSTGGDSGGPFYYDDSGGVRIRGMHLGRIGSDMYAHKWSTIRDTFGVYIANSPP